MNANGIAATRMPLGIDSLGRWSSRTKGSAIPNGLASPSTRGSRTQYRSPTHNKASLPFRLSTHRPETLRRQPPTLGNPDKMISVAGPPRRNPLNPPETPDELASSGRCLRALNSQIHPHINRARPLKASPSARKLHPNIPPQCPMAGKMRMKNLTKPL